MINNKQLRKTVFALYAGVPIEKLSAKHYGRVNNEIRIARKDILQGLESAIMRVATSPLAKKARVIDTPIEQVAEIEQQALIKLRDYKIEELEELRQWDDELDTYIQNPTYRASLIGKHASEYLQVQTQSLQKGQNKKKESQLVQIVQDTIIINEHYKKTPLKRLNFNSHMYNTLKKLGIKKAIDITRYSKEDILKQSQVGKDNIENLQKKLKELGLALR